MLIQVLWIRALTLVQDMGLRSGGTGWHGNDGGVRTVMEEEDGKRGDDNLHVKMLNSELYVSNL